MRTSCPDSPGPLRPGRSLAGMPGSLLLFAALILPAALTLAVPAAGQPAASYAEQYRAAVEEADAQIRRGEWERLESSLRKRIAGLLGAGLPTPGLQLPEAVARLAVAEAGLGRQEDALWHWAVAQNLDRAALSAEQLRSFGPSGEMLAGHPLRRAGEVPAGMDIRRPGQPGGAALVRPRRVKGEFPDLPAGARAFSHPQSMQIVLIVDAEVRARHPVVVRST